MKVSTSISRDALFSRMDVAKRTTELKPDRDQANRLYVIGKDRERFTKLEGSTLEEMNLCALQKAQGARQGGQTLRFGSLVVGGGMMAIGYANSATGLMAGGLGVMVVGGMFLANFVGERSWEHMRTSAALGEWQRDVVDNQGGASEEIDEMIDTMRDRINRRDFEGALASGLQIVETEQDVAVGGVTLPKRRAAQV